MIFRLTLLLTLLLTVPAHAAYTNIQLRRDTPSNWATYNPILMAGEPGCEMTGIPPRCTAQKVGDGVTAWASLPYITSPWVDDRAVAALADADALAVAGGKPLVITRVWATVPTTLNAPSVQVLPGGQLGGTGTTTIVGTFSGSDGCFGTGRSIDGLQDTYPDYWTKSGDMTDNFIKAAASVKTKFGVVRLNAASYTITAPVYFDGVALQGVDGYSSQIHVTGAITALKFTGSRKQIGNFSVWFDSYTDSAAPTTAVGVQFGGNTYGTGADQFSNNTVEQVYVRYAGRSFASESAGSSGTLWNNTFINCRSDFQAEYGWYFNAVVGSTTQTWINCMIDGVTVDGSLGYTAQSAGWYINNVDDVAWINCQADDMYDGKAIYINQASLADIQNFRSESSQFITNTSTLIYANAALSASGVKLQASVVDPGAGNSANIIRFGANGGGTVGTIETQTNSLTSGTLYKVNTNGIAYGRGRVTITDPRVWLADVRRDDTGERTVFANKGPRFGANASNPTVGTYEVGDTFGTVTVGDGRPVSRICTVAGTMGTLAGVTASTTSGATLVSTASTGSLREGDYITIAGVTGVKRIVHIRTSTEFYIDSAASATVSGAAVAYSPATFALNGQSGYRSGTATPVGAVTPYFVGEEYLNSTAGQWYKSKGLTNADWATI